jgi:hypothetical protein
MVLSPERFAAASKPKRPRCGIAKIMDGLTPKDQAILTTALADPKVTASAIESVLRDEGVKAPQSVISRHRRKQCSCGG